MERREGQSPPGRDFNQFQQSSGNWKVDKRKRCRKPWSPRAEKRIRMQFAQENIKPQRGIWLRVSRSHMVRVKTERLIQYLSAAHPPAQTPILPSSSHPKFRQQIILRSNIFNTSVKPEEITWGKLMLPQ